MTRPLVSLLVLLLACSCTEAPEPTRPVAGFTPDQVDLGLVDWSAGRPEPVRLVLFNTGGVSLSLDSVDVEGAWTASVGLPGPLPAPLDPGVGLSVLVTFVGAPTADQSFPAEVTARLSTPSEGFSTGVIATASVQLEVDCDVDDDGWPGLACGGLDCDDLDPQHNPDSPELCNGLDDDCDGLAPGEADADGDGFLACAECDDADATAYPGAEEVCDGHDNDCDPATWAPGGEQDFDTDGFLACQECDDLAHHNAPGNVEVCDGLDNDCDGEPAAVETDDDGDGQTECDGDCDDTDPSRRRFLAEACNGVDDDCDGVVPADETDVDGDGFMACAECDDAAVTVFPGALELCNGVDDDCDGDLGPDEVDDDGDGFDECGGDCDDSSADAWPGRAEDCDGLDNDCDGELEEGFLRVPEDHPTIQEALDARTGGDEICLAAGGYQEELAVEGTTEAVIIGRLGSAQTSIVGADYLAGPLVYGDPAVPLLRLEGLSLSHAGSALDFGGANLELASVDISDIQSSAGGSEPVRVIGSNVDLSEVTFDGLTSSDDNAIYFESSVVIGAGVVVSGCSGSSAALQISGGSAALVDLVIEGSQATAGLWIEGAEVSLSRGSIVDNSAEGIVALFSSVVSLDLMTIARNGDVGLDAGSGSQVEVTSTVFAANCLMPYYAVAVTLHEVTAALQNVQILGNDCFGLALGTSTVVAEGLAAVGNDTGLALYGGAELAIVDSDLSGNGVGIARTDLASVLVATHTNIGANTTDLGGPAPVSFIPGLAGNLSADPQYLDLSAADPLDWDIHLSLGSPLVDAGFGLDPDGSTADIGSFGGPAADLWDLDGDGWPSWWQPGPYHSASYPASGLDCDDRDPEVGPDDC